MVAPALVGPIAAPIASTNGSRGKAATVTMRRTTALEPYLEGQALVGEGKLIVETILTAAACGSRQVVVNEIGRLGHRLEVFGAWCFAMAGELEK